MGRTMSRANSAAYKRHRARCLAQRPLICWLCQEHIDPSLKYPDPMSATADHLEPVSTGGHELGPIRPAHFKCNNARKNKPQGEVTRSMDNHALDW